MFDVCSFALLCCQLLALSYPHISCNWQYYGLPAIFLCFYHFQLQTHIPKMPDNVAADGRYLLPTTSRTISISLITFHSPLQQRTLLSLSLSLLNPTTRI